MHWLLCCGGLYYILQRRDINLVENEIMQMGFLKWKVFFIVTFLNFVLYAQSYCIALVQELVLIGSLLRHFTCSKNYQIPDRWFAQHPTPMQLEDDVQKT